MSIRSLTQEDPIGLAGGLNLYGFASGDPVNFGDPFGLRPDPCTGPLTSAVWGCIGRRVAPAAELVEIIWTAETLVLPMGGAGVGRAAIGGKIGQTFGVIRAGRQLAAQSAAVGRALLKQEGDRILTASRHVMTGSRASRAAHDFAQAGLDVADVARAVADDIGDLSKLAEGYSRSAVEVGGRAIGYSRQTLDTGETIVNFWLKQ